uniref:Uncharacterized protein n=1 Tax=Anopheles farauti TaxID=69004 RepID=A0A182QG99_9DIPT
MTKYSADFTLLNEILYRQRRLIRTGPSRTANRTIGSKIHVKIQNSAHKILPRRKKQFQNAVDIFIASSRQSNRSSARVNELRQNRAGRMASKFLNLSHADQSSYLNCADMLEHQNQATVCSDPFQLFLHDFCKECDHLKSLEEIQLPPTRPVHNQDADDIEDDDALDPEIAELSSKEQTLSAAQQTWNALSDEAREPYRFRAIMAALFPITIDQAF